MKKNVVVLLALVMAMSFCMVASAALAGIAHIGKLIHEKTKA